MGLAQKKYYENNKEKHKQGMINWKNQNPNYGIEYYNKNKEEFKEKLKKYYKDNKEKINKQNQNNYNKNKNSILIKVKEYQESIKINPEKLEKVKLRNKNYQKEYYKKNPHISLLRNQIRNIKNRLGTQKEKSAIKELKYTPLEFKKHIENSFLEGMNWDNIGNKNNNWNVDHKIPISWFKKLTPYYVVNDLNNLQPMWGLENKQKSNTTYNKISKEYYDICKIYLLENKIDLIKTI